MQYQGEFQKAHGMLFILARHLKNSVRMYTIGPWASVVSVHWLSHNHHGKWRESWPQHSYLTQFQQSWADCCNHCPSVSNFCILVSVCCIIWDFLHYDSFYVFSWEKSCLSFFFRKILKLTLSGHHLEVFLMPWRLWLKWRHKRYFCEVLTPRYSWNIYPYTYSGTR